MVININTMRKSGIQSGKKERHDVESVVENVDIQFTWSVDIS